jgi:hypothetical protein
MHANDCSNEYHLIVAETRFRELQAEMREAHLAREIQARDTSHSSLLDRLIALAGRGAQALMPHRKVGAAA